jgi:hypothetical protein
MRVRPRSAVPLVPCLLALAGACTTPHIQYRTDLAACDARSGVRACAAHTVEERDEYLLGFVELDDQGWLWDRRQLYAVLDELTAAGARDDLLMVVFVHGWKHDASPCDTNVACLREVLLRLADIEEIAADREGRAPRKVAGIYVGWRGLSIRGRFVSNLSFYDRKATADRVGARGVTEILLRLDSFLENHRQRLRPGAQSRLVIVGHSFGGQVVHSALSQLLMERSLAEARGVAAAPQPFADLVVLVNPAFEAARYQPLFEIVTERRFYPPEQRPILAILTSEGDQATGRAFPAGRSLSTLFQKHRDRYQRSANRQAVGHFEPYFSHELVAAADEGESEPEPTSRPDCGCPYLVPAAEVRGRTAAAMARMVTMWSGEPPAPGWELALPGSVLRHNGRFGPLNPYLVVRVDNAIISAHSQIYRPRFIDFLRYFIALTMAPRTAPETALPGEPAPR